MKLEATVVDHQLSWIGLSLPNSIYFKTYGGLRGVVCAAHLLYHREVRSLEWGTHPSGTLWLYTHASTIVVQDTVVPKTQSSSSTYPHYQVPRIWQSTTWDTPACIHAPLKSYTVSNDQGRRQYSLV